MVNSRVILKVFKKHRNIELQFKLNDGYQRLYNYIFAFHKNKQLTFNH